MTAIGKELCKIPWSNNIVEDTLGNSQKLYISYMYIIYVLYLYIICMSDIIPVMYYMSVFFNGNNSCPRCFCNLKVRKDVQKIAIRTY